MPLKLLRVLKCIVWVIEQLCDIRFSHCLRELTDNDMSRIGTLMEENLYNEVLKYMKENNLKLEQEIVSYYLVKGYKLYNPTAILI